MITRVNIMRCVTNMGFVSKNKAWPVNNMADLFTIRHTPLAGEHV